MTINKLPKGVYISGQGTPVVLLHSSLSSARQWLPLVKLLEPYFLVINIDILGYGNADKVTEPRNYNFDVEIDRFEYIIETVASTQALR